MIEKSLFCRRKKLKSNTAVWSCGEMGLKLDLPEELTLLILLTCFAVASFDDYKISYLKGLWLVDG